MTKSKRTDPQLESRVGYLICRVQQGLSFPVAMAAMESDYPLQPYDQEHLEKIIDVATIMATQSGIDTACARGEPRPGPPTETDILLYLQKAYDRLWGVRGYD